MNTPETARPFDDLRTRVLLDWWHLRAWFHRCPECGQRPDRHYGGHAPRWEDDKIAAMLGIGQYGCRRCGQGSIEERDLRLPPGQDGPQ